MKRAIVCFVALVIAAGVAQAQQGAMQGQPGAMQGQQGAGNNAVASSVQKLVTTMSKNILAGAQEMPAEKYDFRPTPQQNTFGHLVVHMIQANYFLCSSIAGAQLPQTAMQFKETDGKTALTDGLTKSFQFCSDSLEKLDDSKLEEPVSMGGRGSMPRGSVIITFAQDYGDHYAQEAAYLRAAGLMPPTAAPAGAAR